MSCAYVAAVQLVDGQVLPQGFHHGLHDRDAPWTFIDKAECFHTPELGEKHEHRVTIVFEGGIELIKSLASPRDAVPGLLSEEILLKLRRFMKGVVDDRRRDGIERPMLDI